eukprot:6144159-Pleurochrysis_carterae.AAC.3
MCTCFNKERESADGNCHEDSQALMAATRAHTRHDWTGSAEAREQGVSESTYRRRSTGSDGSRGRQAS